jgi:PAS domain S-box-containing protein
LKRDSVHGGKAALEASERRLRDIVETSADWIWETDRDHRFTSVGRVPDDNRIPDVAIVGRTIWEVAGGDPVRDADWARHKAAVDARLPFRSLRFSLVTRSDRLVYFRAGGNPVFDGAGGFQGYRGTAADVTETVAAEGRAAQAEAMLRDAIESISGGILICDAGDRIVLSNQHLRRAYADCAGCLEAGTPYEAFTRASVARGYFPDALGREEEFIAMRLANHRAAAGPTLYRQKEARWALIHERRMGDGGTVSLGLDATALKATENALIASEERLDRAQEIARIGSWEEDLATGSVVWSREMCRLRGIPASAATGLEDVRSRGIDPADAQRVSAWFADLRKGAVREPIECRLVRPDGTAIVASYDGRAIADENGRITHIAGTLQDMTRRTAIARQLLQAQKMEAIAVLAGGTAHDFNNLLGVVIGNLDLLRDAVRDQPELDELVRDALDAGLRGAELTRHLLAFARRQQLNPEPVALNDLVGTAVLLLRRSLGDDVEIALDPAPDLWPVRVDPDQLSAAITNLAANARDAMEAGGRITIATRNCCLDEDYAKSHAEIAPGDYAVIEFSDTGAGMSPDVVRHIFEPFYTTKDQGKGTGLGLSMVFGFLHQSGGHINVYSEPGLGTTFRLYLPRERGDARPAEAAVRVLPVAGRGETVLVVEDDAKLRPVVVRQLTDLGYRVLAAEDAPRALETIAGSEPIDLMFTDIVMPGGLNGLDLAREAASRRPQLKVLLTSGFPQTRMGNAAPHMNGHAFLGKPYRRDELARIVRETLDAPRRHEAQLEQG